MSNNGAVRCRELDRPAVPNELRSKAENGSNDRSSRLLCPINGLFVYLAARKLDRFNCTICRLIGQLRVYIGFDSDGDGDTAYRTGLPESRLPNLYFHHEYPTLNWVVILTPGFKSPRLALDIC